ncbi:hypothetical protein [Photobacterium leiognathi]|uniref:hypothetical protein n=1 Tax=Photobacterium leiognathi TaxID=553611 RepID=UPI002980D1E5|nr:hypothetical protein [Photobacterium leiognathi]
MAFTIETKLKIKDKYDAFIALSYIEKDKDKRIRKKRDIERTQNNLLYDFVLTEVEKEYSESNIDSIISYINKEIENNKLSKDDLALIDKNNQRLINWIYCFLKKRRHNFNFEKEKTLEFRISFNSNNENNLYIIRFNEIVNYIKELNQLKYNKIILIEKLISEYNEIYKNDSIESWIEKNNKDKIIPWAFNYIKNELDQDIENELFNVLCLSDKHAVILSFFDSYDDLTYKKYHISNMKKAWNQKKLREKNKDRKAYSFVMDKDIHKKLDFLSDLCGKTKNEVVQELIKEKYYSLQNKN